VSLSDRNAASALARSRRVERLATCHQACLFELGEAAPRERIHAVPLDRRQLCARSRKILAQPRDLGLARGKAPRP
jgi:hypothetical protein